MVRPDSDPRRAGSGCSSKIDSRVVERRGYPTDLESDSGSGLSSTGGPPSQGLTTPTAGAEQTVCLQYHAHRRERSPVVERSTSSSLVRCWWCWRLSCSRSR